MYVNKEYITGVWLDGEGVLEYNTLQQLWPKKESIEGPK